MSENNNKVGESEITKASKDITAGSVRGITQVLVGHPLDTIKVRLQTQVLHGGSNGKYNGVFDCFKTSLKEEGVLGLWKGAPSPIAGAALYSASLFFAYGQSKRIVGVDSNNPTIVKMMIVGGMTGGFAAFVECPIDLLKSKLQVQYTVLANGTKIQNFEGYSSTFECAKSILKKRGIAGIYQGFTATICRNIPGSSAYFASYEIIRKEIAGDDNHSISPLAVMIAGGISGLVFWVSVFPFDVIKSCIQTDNSSNRKFITVLGTAKYLYSEYGLYGFWRGFSACFLRSIPVNACSFLAYESSRKLLN